MATNHFGARTTIVGRNTAHGFLVRKILTLFGLPEQHRDVRSPIPGIGDDARLAYPVDAVKSFMIFRSIEEKTA
jgi:hypothetical protein